MTQKYNTGDRVLSISNSGTILHYDSEYGYLVSWDSCKITRIQEDELSADIREPIKKRWKFRKNKTAL